jgi:hypothetical protein
VERGRSPGEPASDDQHIGSRFQHSAPPRPPRPLVQRSGRCRTPPGRGSYLGVPFL